MGYGDKENGQTLKNEDLSAFAPQNNEILNLWLDFQKVARFIDDNKDYALVRTNKGKEVSQLPFFAIIDYLCLCRRCTLLN